MPAPANKSDITQAPAGSIAASAAAKFRIFFALWPDTEIRADLLNLCQELPNQHGRPVHAHNLHITLSFIGEVDQTQLAAFAEAAADIHCNSFTLRLDRLGYFARTQVLWLGCERIPDELPALVGQLNKSLRRIGYRPERRPYQPHVTLLRNARPLARLPEFSPILWPVDGFKLVQSVLQPCGIRYEVMKEYGFTC